MKKLTFITLIITCITSTTIAQSSNDILNLLIQNKTITQLQADSLRAEAAIKQQDEIAKQKSFFATAANKLQFSGYTHIRYQQLDDNSKNDGFDLRRAYFTAKANISPNWTYLLQIDFANSPAIVDAYAQYQINDNFNLRLGQQVIPFSLNNITSNTKSELIDRAQVVEALAARSKDAIIGNQGGRDIGLTAYGQLLKSGDKYIIDYTIGVFNGQGVNKADKNETKDIIARVTATPIKGLTFGGSFYDGRGYKSSTDPLVAGNFDRNRWGAELNYNIKSLTLTGEYIAGKDAETEKDGYYAQIAYYIVPDALQGVIKYDVFNPDKDGIDNILTNYVVGVNYSFNKWVKLQLAYTISEEEGTSIDNNYGAAQLQIAF